MRGELRTAALALGVWVLAATGSSAAEQEAINKAIDRGVAGLNRLQGRDGTWPHAEIGATALAGLALLECQTPADDPAIVRAADAVRQASIQRMPTYSIALAILFLDRLGDPRDVPLIESLTVRLLAGQTLAGAWTYPCPPISAGEAQRLATLIRNRNELKGSRKLPRTGKRTVRDLPRPIQQQLALIARMPVGGGPWATMAGDNSNTQFAALALWVARRHGLPVDLALQRAEAHFRRTQLADGGWSYMARPPMMGPPPGVRPPPGTRIAPPPGLDSTASMTCAGLLGLAYGHGTRAGRNLAADLLLKRGLLALGTALEGPRREQRPGGPPFATISGKSYYFLWSMERVAVALKLETIGKKDWYNWGATILLGTQQEDGTWRGEFANCGADTCFALLFLRRSNLASDLTARLGKVKDPTEVELTVGGVGGAGLPGRRKRIKSGLAPDDNGKADSRPKKTGPVKPIPTEVENAAAGKLSDALVQATGAEQDEVLKRLRDSKGVDYTEALLLAIPRLDDVARTKARAALRQRFTRLTARSLLNYLKDPDPEVRRAALLASAERDLREHIPIIIGKLADPEPSVGRAAHTALKTLSEKDFGPAADATPEETDKAIAAWKAWWHNSGKK